MQPSDSDRIKEIFANALELPPNQRGEYLDGVCANDASLRAEIERLLGTLDKSGGILDARSAGDYLGLSHSDGGALAEGDQVGRFRIVRLIGKGGMGEVYEAADPEYRRRVALKTIRPEFLQRSDFLARFRREIRLAWKVTDPNVCRMYDVGQCRLHDTETVYLTMELLEGETLADRLSRGLIDSAEAAAIIRQVAAGLAALHQVNIVHRDLKPSNVMLVPTAEGTRCVITDFGLAHGPEGESELLTSAGQVMGTPAYMAPEQLTSKKVGPPADIYSLGVVMYEILCGRRPFDADQLVECATQKLSRPPRAPSRVGPVDPEWDRLVLSCLDLEPGRRPAAREVGPQLDRLTRRYRQGRARKLARRILVDFPRRSRVVYVIAVAGVVSVAIPFQAPALRTPLLRRACGKFPNVAAVCELPAEKDIAVLPFAIKASGRDDQALASGLARHIRDSFQRLRPKPGAMCIHLRNDRLADGVHLVLEGEVEVRGDRIVVSVVVREAVPGGGGDQPLTLRRIDFAISRSAAKRLHAELLSRLADALELPLAGAEWREWLRWSPAHSESLLSYFRGLGYLQQGLYEEAARAFSFTIDPANDFAFVPAQVALGDAYRLAFNKTHEETLAVRARQAYRRAVSLDRDFGLSGGERGWGELEASVGETQASIEHFSNALQLWAYDQSVQQSLAAAYEAASQDKLSEKVLRTAVEVSPRCWLVHNTLAHFYSRHARLPEAERELLEVVRLAPRNANAYHNLAFDYIKAGRLEDAIEMASRCIRLRQIPLAYATLGRAYLYRGCTDDALINLRKAVEVDPNDYLLWANLAEGLSATRPDSDEAKAAYSRTVDLTRISLQKVPTGSYPRAQMALNLSRLGRDQAARQESQDVLLLAVEVLNRLNARGRALNVLERALRAGLSVYEIQMRSGLAPLRSDPEYASMLRRLNLNPAADPGGVTPGSAGCPASPQPGTGIRGG
jgi:tetratricopeptide (TPR) repeat protein/tRNA A-37 threonylcarbamoyl transferase component Bud32